MKRYLEILLIASSILFTGAQPYNYQELTKPDPNYTRFGDYIPQVKLYQETTPQFLEDYYLLYGMKQYYNEPFLRKNIEYLEIALNSNFRHPSRSLVKINDEKEYYKYRNLLFMHINLLIMKNYLTIAALYDKPKVYFYDGTFGKQLTESFNMAEGFYKEAIPYWEKAKLYAEKASEVKITLDLSYMETERYRIVKKDLDYGKIIGANLQRLSKKQNDLARLIAQEK